jgi:hypothetical protein
VKFVSPSEGRTASWEMSDVTYVRYGNRFPSLVLGIHDAIFEDLEELKDMVEKME